MGEATRLVRVQLLGELIHCPQCPWERPLPCDDRQKMQLCQIRSSVLIKIAYWQGESGVWDLRYWIVISSQNAVCN